MAAQDANQPFHWHYAELDDRNFQVHRGGLLLLLVVFAALLMLTLLGLYVRWACRYRRSPAVEEEARPPGLDPGTINSFPVRLHRAPGDDAQCSICISGLVEGEKVRVLPGCGHGFHPECVDKWLRAQSSCPLCRASLGGPDAAVV